MILKIIQQINQMFDKIQMILMIKTSISNNRISRLNQNFSDETLPVIKLRDTKINERKLI